MLKTKMFISSETKLINKNFTELCHLCNNFYDLSLTEIVDFFDTYQTAEAKIVSTFDEITSTRSFVKERLQLACFQILIPLLPEGLTLENAITTYHAYRRGEDIKSTRKSKVTLKEFMEVYRIEKFQLPALQKFEKYCFYTQEEISSLYKTLLNCYEVGKTRYFAK